MTWYADQIEGRPIDSALEKLLKQRESLVEQVLTLKNSPVGKSNAAAVGRIEDLTKLASKIKNIDKRLGRIAT